MTGSHQEPMMKKLFILGILLTVWSCLSAKPVTAQTGFDFGVKLGFSSTGMMGNDIEKTSFPKNGFIGGAFVRWHFVTKFTLQMEVLYSQKGTKCSVEGTSGLVDTMNIKLDYLEIPVLFRYDFPIPGKFKPHLLIGPTIAFNVNAEATTDDENSYYPAQFDIPNTRNVDFGAVMGVGIDFTIGRGTIVVDTRYTLGLRGVFEDMSTDGINNESKEIPFANEGKALDLSNGGFSFMLGYAF